MTASMKEPLSTRCRYRAEGILPADYSTEMVREKLRQPLVNRRQKKGEKRPQPLYLGIRRSENLYLVYAFGSDFFFFDLQIEFAIIVL